VSGTTSDVFARAGVAAKPLRSVITCNIPLMDGARRISRITYVCRLVFSFCKKQIHKYLDKLNGCW
jgi:hypothetical protein